MPDLVENFVLLSVRDPGPIMELTRRMIFNQGPVLGSVDSDSLAQWARQMDLRVKALGLPIATLTCDKRGVHFFHAPTGPDNLGEARVELSVHPTPGQNLLVRLSWVGVGIAPRLFDYLTSLQDQIVEAQFHPTAPAFPMPTKEEASDARTR